MHVPSLAPQPRPVRRISIPAAMAAACAAICLSLAPAVSGMPFSNRVTLPSGEKIFVAGFNLAWINYAGDVGDQPLDATRFRAAMKAVADSGGNTMRVW